MGISAAACRGTEEPNRCASNYCSSSAPLLSKYRIANEIANSPSTLVNIALGKKDKQEYALRITYRYQRDVLLDRRDTRGIYAIDPRTLSHPNISNYLELLQTNDLIATITTYYPGGSLEDFVLEPSNNYTNANISKFLSRLSSLFRQITDACAYLHHQKKLIHGNIKLTNIFLKDAKRTIAVLGDLGRLSQWDSTPEKMERPDPSEIGRYIGTSIFIAPEVIAGGPVSPKSDIYAIGACLYVALDSTGPFPEGDDNYVSMIEASVAADPGRRMLELSDQSIPGAVREFLNAAVDPNPASRDSAEALLSRHWLSSTGVLSDATEHLDSDDAPRLFVTSDEGRDLDFELGKVVGYTLMRRKPLRIIGCVAGLWPAKQRARLIKGTLIELGLESIPVAIGAEKYSETLETSPYEFAVPYLAPESGLYTGSGLDLCKETLERSPDKTVTFILQAGPYDVWKCLETFPELFMRKVSRVVLRSEVQTRNSGLELSDDGRILPNVATAASLDRNPMCELFDMLQDLGIPMLVITRWASYACKLSFDTYRALGETQHPVAQRLMIRSQQSIQFLWDRCVLPADDPRRNGLPVRCNKEWFCNMFLEGKGLDRGQGDAIWDLCKTFSSYSPLQLMASVPDLRAKYFKPTTVKVKSKRGNQVTHEILGLTEENHGVIEPKELTSYIENALLTGFTGTDTVQQYLLIISDDGKDLDDELTKVLLKSLDERQLARCSGFIAALHPAEVRARLAKGTLDCLGLDTPVGIGSGMGSAANHAYEFDVDYLADAKDVQPSGVDLFVRQLEQAADGLFTLVVLSGMRDAWDLLNNHTELFRRKVTRVVIMGGVEVADNALVKSEEGYLVPDTAANNVFDMEAAQNFYRELQRQCIPMTIVSRWAAYAAKLPLSLYDRMAKTGHPVACRLQRAQQKSLQHLWTRANMSSEDPAREGLPARCDKAWFSKVFLGGKGMNRSGSQSVWDLATTFQPYDCIALLGALPGIRDRYLNPTVFEAMGIHGCATHEVMGLSEKMNGVRDPSALRQWLETALLEGIDHPNCLSRVPSAGKQDVSRQPSQVKTESMTNMTSKERLAQVHHVRAFAQKYAKLTPKMKPGRMVVMRNLVTFCSEEGLL